VSEAATSTGSADLHVLFHVGDAEYAVSAADVVQMESYAGATRVPGVPDWIAGLVQIRGRVVPVVDVRRRFGLPSETPALGSRVIVLGAGTRVIGLLVDAAREVTRLAADEMLPPPDLVVDRTGGLVRAVTRVGDRIVLVIDAARVTGEDWAHGD
jgi:purine-binding chemotaxis protein CheW